MADSQDPVKDFMQGFRDAEGQQQVPSKRGPHGCISFVFCLGFASVFIVPCVGYHLWDDSNERARLREMNANGNWIQGRVTAASEEAFDWKGIETVSFVYSVEGEEYEGKDRRWKWAGAAKVGDSIRILVHPDRPKEYRTKKVPEEDLAFSWWRIAGNAAPACLAMLAGAVFAWLKIVLQGN